MQWQGWDSRWAISQDIARSMPDMGKEGPRLDRGAPRHEQAMQCRQMKSRDNGLNWLTALQAQAPQPRYFSVLIKSLPLPLLPF